MTYIIFVIAWHAFENPGQDCELPFQITFPIPIHNTMVIYLQLPPAPGHGHLGRRSVPTVFHGGCFFQWLLGGSSSS